MDAPAVLYLLDLARIISERTKYPEAVIKDILNCYGEVSLEYLQKNVHITFPKLGRISIKHRQWMGHDINTNTLIPMYSRKFKLSTGDAAEEILRNRKKKKRTWYERHK